MKMKILRKGEEDIAIGYCRPKIYIRKGKACRKLKKGTVIPSSKVDDVETYISTYIDDLVDKGYVYAGTVDVTDENPYPILKQDVGIHWAFDPGASNQDIVCSKSMKTALQAAHILSNAGMCKVSTVGECDLDRLITLEEHDTQWRIGTVEHADAAISHLRISGGTINPSNGVSPFLVMLYLCKQLPAIFSLANSLSEEIVPDLNSAESQLPFKVTDEIRQVGEMLGLCIAPVNWNTIGNSSQSSQNWFF